jgi:hypothetical protein
MRAGRLKAIHLPGVGTKRQAVRIRREVLEDFLSGLEAT